MAAGLPKEDLHIPAKEPIAHYVRNNLLITTSGVYSDAALRCAVEEIGIDRVRMSIDYPYEDTPGAVDFIRNSPFDEADRDRLIGGNACRWFGLV